MNQSRQRISVRLATLQLMKRSIMVYIFPGASLSLRMSCLLLSNKRRNRQLLDKRLTVLPSHLCHISEYHIIFSSMNLYRSTFSNNLIMALQSRECKTSRAVRVHIRADFILNYLKSWIFYRSITALKYSILTDPASAWPFPRGLPSNGGLPAILAIFTSDRRISSYRHLFSSQVGLSGIMK